MVIRVSGVCSLLHQSERDQCLRFMGCTLSKWNWRPAPACQTQTDGCVRSLDWTVECLCCMSHDASWVAARTNSSNGFIQLHTQVELGRLYPHGESKILTNGHILNRMWWHTIWNSQVISFANKPHSFYNVSHIDRINWFTCIQHVVFLNQRGLFNL